MITESIRPFLTWENPTALPYFEVDSTHPRAVRTLCETGLFTLLTRDAPFVPFVTRVVYAAGRHWSPAYIARCTKGGNYLLHRAVGTVKHVFKGRKIVSVKAENILLFMEEQVGGEVVSEPEDDVARTVMEVLNGLVDEVVVNCMPELALVRRPRAPKRVHVKGVEPKPPKPPKQYKVLPVDPYLERYTPYQQYMIYEMVRNLYVMGRNNSGSVPLGVRFMCWFYRSFIAPSFIPHPPDMDIPSVITHKNTLDFLEYIKRTYPREWDELVDRAVLSYVPPVPTDVD